MLCTLLLPIAFTKVTLESLLAPRALEGIGDRGECADTLVFAGVLQV